MWGCLNCGEMMEESYGFCWKCGAKKGAPASGGQAEVKDASGESGPVPKWEYWTLMFSIPLDFFAGPNLQVDAFNDELNKAGAAGWEMVNVFDINAGEGHTSFVVATFKRRA